MLQVQASFRSRRDSTSAAAGSLVTGKVASALRKKMFLSLIWTTKDVKMFLKQTKNATSIKTRNSEMLSKVFSSKVYFCFLEA